MAFTTRCPHCQTAFRVANDQLKLRAGLVRCGACQKVFNGLEHLLPQDRANAAAVPAVPAGAQAAASEIPTAADSFEAELEAAPESRAQAALAPVTAGTLSETFEEDAWVTPAPIKAPISEELAGPPAPSQTPVEAESGDAPGLSGPQADAPESATRRAQLTAENSSGSPAEGTGSGDNEEPGFVRLARRKQRLGSRLRRFMSFGSLLLLLLLLGQATTIFRHQLAASFPQTLPTLQRFCDLAGCRMGLPAQIDAVSIESSELQQSPSRNDTLSVNILLRNRSAVAQTWPNIELSLTDANEKTIVRRVFVPAEYLPAQKDAPAALAAPAGFAPMSEQSIRLLLEVPQLKPSGYRLYLFYP